jgi:hypothetical protein
MKLKIQVLDETNSDILDTEIDVPDEIPYPPLPARQSGPISLVGLKTAIDFHLYTLNLNK